ncbi:MAG: TonB-dependent receptor [Opitutaceae bacterium]|nr:TonB-dependent receptor [Opitutaceae bacterium]
MSVILSAALGSTVAFAQSAPPAEPEHEPATVQLAPLVVAATRSPQDPRYVPSSVTSVPLLELRVAQIPRLTDALKAVPGIVVARTGATGGQASVFIRGAASHQTLFVVDGIRMNDRSALYQNLLGGASIAGYDRVEVLRGPQSTLYGSNAIGGIILLNTTHGCGPLSGRVTAVGGSDSSWGGTAEASGGTRTTGYSAHVERYATDNQRDWNKYRQWGASARVETIPVKGLLFGVTARAQEGEFQEPGSRTWPSLGTVNDDNHLGTAYAELKAEEHFTSRLTVGQHNRHYRFATAWGTSDLRNRRRILDWQNTWTPVEEFEVIAGTNWETSRYWVNHSPSSDRVTAAYASSTYRPAKQWVITGGLRYDDHGTFSSATTGRAGVTFLPTATTKLRASFGSGFIAPGIDDRFGVPSWGQRPNPALKPEKANGWDVGIDQEIAFGKSTASLTYFDNAVKDLFEWQVIDFTTFEGQIVNRAKANLRGVEAALASSLTQSLRTRLSYTYLDARDGDTHQRLTRNPRHVLDGQVTWETASWTLGVGGHLIAGRVESVSVPSGYATFRAFGSYQVTRQLKAGLRVENGLDRAYEEVLGYPALGRQVYGTLEWSF